MKNKIILFQNQEIRRTWHDNQWVFSIIDVIAILTKSVNPQAYWRKLKERLLKSGNETVTNCHGLKMKAVDGKMRTTDVANIEQLLRLIQSIPSPKAEPFKLWLARVGKERIDEIENPVLAQERMKRLYEQKGYSKDWIDKRLRGIAIRQNLTEEWQERGIEHKKDYAILTAEISKATFGMTPSEYKEHKGMPKKSGKNLRDNMTDLELIFTMLGEKVTTEISKQEEPVGMPENKQVAKRGGKVAGNARIEAEQEIGQSIISDQSHSPESLLTS
jgi:DNA-damage-inducible protein D